MDKVVTVVQFPDICEREQEILWKKKIGLFNLYSSGSEL
jgi:hypothetical protein